MREDGRGDFARRLRRIRRGLEHQVALLCEEPPVKNLP